jgi:predicted RNA binding protein YcfA (HicA-like mRNA interferase family)
MCLLYSNGRSAALLSVAAPGPVQSYDQRRTTRTSPRSELVPLKVGEMIRLIEEDGWYLVAVRGSHRQYKHPAKPGRVTIPGKPSRVLPLVA